MADLNIKFAEHLKCCGSRFNETPQQNLFTLGDLIFNFWRNDGPATRLPYFQGWRSGFENCDLRRSVGGIIDMRDFARKKPRPACHFDCSVPANFLAAVAVWISRKGYKVDLSQPIVSANGDFLSFSDTEIFRQLDALLAKEKKIDIEYAFGGYIDERIIDQPDRFALYFFDGNDAEDEEQLYSMLECCMCVNAIRRKKSWKFFPHIVRETGEAVKSRMRRTKNFIPVDELERMFRAIILNNQTALLGKKWQRSIECAQKIYNDFNCDQLIGYGDDWFTIATPDDLDVFMKFQASIDEFNGVSFELARECGADSGAFWCDFLNQLAKIYKSGEVKIGKKK